MYPDAVIFDFDGIIVDTEPIHYRSFQIILEPLALGYSWETYHDIYMGFDDRDAFRTAFSAAGRQLADDELRQLIDRKAAVFEEIVSAGVTAYPGVTELVQRLAEHQVPMAICSGALASDILPIVNQLDIRKYFSQIVTAEDVSRSKPDPACYLLAKKKLVDSFSGSCCRLQNIWAIEDTPAGIQAARGAGLKVIAVSNSYPAERLSEADAVLESLEQFGIVPF